ncbi:MAG TPA: sigma-70 family RNA polymerase sigma factor [Polyangium sp.]|nr:sigma-70 family RNA polymerase sigma factor [Polyangium sp.]
MHADRVPSRAPTPSDIYRAYVAVLPKWLRRFRMSGDDVADLMQEVWLAVCSGSVPLPNDVREARLELFKVTRVVAQRLRRQHEREADRLVPELDDNGLDGDGPAKRRGPKPTNSVDQEELAALTLGVFEAFERLSPKHRQLAREYYVLGYTIKEMAQRAGVPEDRMEKWIAGVRDELEKTAQKPSKKHQSGMLVLPFAFDFDPATRAAFCSIWETEGDVVEMGNGGTSPLPPSVPPVSPIAPILAGITGSAVGAVGLTILVVMLLLFPAGIVALDYFWKPPHVETAQTGLRVPAMPEVGAIEDVVPAYPLPMVPRPLPPTARPARKSVPVKDEPTSATAFERGATD